VSRTALALRIGTLCVFQAVYWYHQHNEHGLTATRFIGST
jgi:hypothetical protein